MDIRYLYFPNTLGQVVAGVDVLALDSEGRTAASIADARGLVKVSEVSLPIEKQRIEKCS